MQRSSFEMYIKHCDGHGVRQAVAVDRADGRVPGSARGNDEISAATSEKRVHQSSRPLSQPPFPLIQRSTLAARPHQWPSFLRSNLSTALIKKQ